MQPVILSSDKWGVHEVRSFYKYLCVCIYLCVCLQHFEQTAVCKLVNHLLQSKGRVEVKAGVYVCPGHTHTYGAISSVRNVLRVYLWLQNPPDRGRLIFMGSVNRDFVFREVQCRYTHVSTDIQGAGTYRYDVHMRTVRRCCTHTNWTPYGRQSCRSREEPRDRITRGFLIICTLSSSRSIPKNSIGFLIKQLLSTLEDEARGLSCWLLSLGWWCSLKPARQ